MRDHKMVLVEGARLRVVRKVMWPWLVRPASSLGPGVSCCLYGNVDPGNLAMSVPMGLAAHFCSLKNSRNHAISVQFAFGGLLLYCSLSGFSEVSLVFLSFPAVLSEAMGRGLSPYLGQNHKAVLLPSPHLSWPVWRQRQEKQGECFQVGDQRLWCGSLAGCLYFARVLSSSQNGRFCVLHSFLYRRRLLKSR